MCLSSGVSPWAEPIRDSPPSARLIHIFGTAVSSGSSARVPLRYPSIKNSVNASHSSTHAFTNFCEREESFIATDVRDAYQGQIHRQTLLLESYSEYLTQTKERIGIGRALKTFKLRTYQLSLLREYVQKKHKVSDIPLSQLDKTFIKGFEYYLTIDRKLKRSSVSSALSTLHS